MKIERLGQMRAVNSGLLGSGFASPVEAVRVHGAMQSQEFALAKWSIGQRVKGTDQAEIDRLFAVGDILRTHVLRPTWHFIVREDLRWLLALTARRLQQRNQGRYRELGLDPSTRSKAQRVVAKELSGDTHRSRKELATILEKSRIATDGQRLPHILFHCELESVICSGIPDGRKQTYALVDDRAPGGNEFTRDQALAELVLRYLGSHGPATVKDLGWWSSLTLTDIRTGLAALGSAVVTETIEGRELWWIEQRPTAPRRTVTVNLLQAFDENVLGYTESRYLGDVHGDAAKMAFRNGAPWPGTVVIDGRLAGQWRRTIEKNEMHVSVTLYEELDASGSSALEKEAEKLGGFFGLPSRLTTSML